MREYRVVCANGKAHRDWGQCSVWPGPVVMDLDRHNDCGSHRVQFRDISDWQDLGADTTGGGEANG